MATRKTQKARRDYGTGTLLVIGSSWYGMWHGPGGRRVKRKLGTARTAGRADGLTKPQAEERLRELRAEAGERLSARPDGSRSSWLAPSTAGASRSTMRRSPIA